MLLFDFNNQVKPHRLFAIDRMTTLVPDSEAPGSYTQQPINGLKISISNTLLKEQGLYNSNRSITLVIFMLTLIASGAAAGVRERSGRNLGAWRQPRRWRPGAA